MCFRCRGQCGCSDKAVDTYCSILYTFNKKWKVLPARFAGSAEERCKMALYQISNEQIAIQVDSMGAELKSLKKTGKGTEYMWEGDPAYWKRTSPVLFPIVGSLRDGSFLLDGKRYPMGQHGFARDMEFQLKEEAAKELWFRLESNAQTLEKYPYTFLLELGYELRENTVVVKWKVHNPDPKKELYFSIGGHPAFRCPLVKGEAQEDYRIWFDAPGKVTAGVIKNGLMTAEQVDYPLEDGCLRVTEHLFDKDALVIENHQAQKAALVKPDGTHYLTVCFDAPLFGVWSQPGKKAPFVCIEPWYGRCDAHDFNGTWQQREWGQCLPAGQSFEASYQISV